MGTWAGMWPYRKQALHSNICSFIKLKLYGRCSLRMESQSVSIIRDKKDRIYCMSLANSFPLDLP